MNILDLFKRKPKPDALRAALTKRRLETVLRQHGISKAQSLAIVADFFNTDRKGNPQ